MRSFKMTSIRPWWRMTAVAGAVAVAVVLAGDAAAGIILSPAETASLNAVVNPRPADVVAAGKIGNVSWRFIFRPSNQVSRQPGDIWVYAALGDFMPGTCGRFPPSDWGPAHPVWFYDSAVKSSQLQVRYGIGWADADVTSVVVRLRDGQQIRLVPVSRYGKRVVAFVVPMQVGIAGATAYLSNGRYATTISPSSPDALTFVNSWVWHSPGGPIRHSPR